jgi:DNA repair protein RecO (recombination protein O)
VIEFQDNGIILSVSLFQENFIIIKIFSKKYGLVAGLMRKSKKSANLVVGDFVFFTWKARLQEQLGFLTIDISNSILPMIFQISYKVYLLNSISSMINILLQDKDPHELLYEAVSNALRNLNKHDDKLVHFKDYVLLELLLTRDLGYGFDWSKCSVTNSTEELYYISPKTGNIVTKEVGDKFADKLFIVPEFILNHDLSYDTDDISKGLELMGYILKQFIFMPNNIKLPQVRDDLVESLHS